MLKKRIYTLFAAVVSGLILVSLVFYFAYRDKNFAVLNPAGTIAEQQKDLMIIITLLMLIIVIPVFVLTFYIAWKYREGNEKANYTPDWDHSRILETIWWGFPIAIIAVISVLIWKSSHSLDPSQPIQSNKPTMKIQVIALEWKWLFIYPEQNIATVNYVEFPEDTPVDFEITSDAAMNSFWIPQLGGQIYAMSGMSTHLHLMADQTGSYSGSSANLSGEGFSGMKFTAKSSTDQDFQSWVQSVKQSQSSLGQTEYDALTAKSQNNPVAYYGSRDQSLYDKVMSKYNGPVTEDDTKESGHAPKHN